MENGYVHKKDPGRSWGFPKEAVHQLGHRLHGFWKRFQDCFKTQTRDSSDYAHHYLSGLLRMQDELHFAGIGREAGVEGQNIQHFMSNIKRKVPVSFRFGMKRNRRTRPLESD